MGLTFASVNVGATQVLPGPQFTSALIMDLIEQEKVTLTAGVPTIWIGALQEQEKKERDISSLRAICCGGSASPTRLIRTFEEKYGIPYIVVYGMTETTPIVALSNYMSWMDDWPIENVLKLERCKG